MQAWLAMGAAMSDDGWGCGQRSAGRWFRAAEEGDLDALRQLIDLCKDTNLDLKDPRGLTALMLAAANGHTLGAQFLIDRGANLDATDLRGWTAATHAAFNGQDRCLRLLAECGADLDARDFLGTTAAMRAALGGHEACLRVLADHGADLLAVDNFGMAAVMHAQRKGHLRCSSLLEEKVCSTYRRLMPRSQRKAFRRTEPPQHAQHCRDVIWRQSDGMNSHPRWAPSAQVN